MTKEICRENINFVSYKYFWFHCGQWIIPCCMIHGFALKYFAENLVSEISWYSRFIGRLQMQLRCHRRTLSRGIKSFEKEQSEKLMKLSLIFQRNSQTYLLEFTEEFFQLRILL